MIGPGGYGPSPGSRIVGWLLALVFVTIALTIVVNLLEAIWPWLVGFGLAIVAAWWLVRRHFSRW